MSLRKRLRRFFCPGCIAVERNRERHAHTIAILERSGERLDRIAERLAAFPDFASTLAEPLRKDESPGE